MAERSQRLHEMPDKSQISLYGINDDAVNGDRRSGHRCHWNVRRVQRRQQASPTVAA